MGLTTNVKQFHAMSSTIRVLASTGGTWAAHCSSNSSLKSHGFNHVFHPRQHMASYQNLLRLRPGFVLTVELNFEDSSQGWFVINSN